MANFFRRLLCTIGLHKWRPSRFMALGSFGPSYQCSRCKKVTQID